MVGFRDRRQVLDGLARFDLSSAFPAANIAAALNTDNRDLTVMIRCLNKKPAILCALLALERIVLNTAAA